MDQYPLDALNKASTDPSLSLHDRIEFLLRVGLKNLNLDVGIVSLVQDGVYQVEHIAPRSARLFDNDRVKLALTYCSITIELGRTIDIPCMARSPFKEHPAYDALGLEAYIGTALFVDNTLYGTVSFLGKAPRDSHFSDEDRVLVESISRRISKAITSRRMCR